MQERPPAGLEAAPLHVDRAERRSVAPEAEWPRVGRTAEWPRAGHTAGRQFAVRQAMSRFVRDTAHQQVDGIGRLPTGGVPAPRWRPVPRSGS